MATIVRGTVPADEFALSHTLGSAPDVEFEVERIVDSGDDALMPLLWVRGDRENGVADLLDADPSVREVELLAAFDDEWLYRMEWVDRIDLVLRMLTTSEATVLDAHGRRDRWTLRVMYPDRDDLSDTHEFCRSHGLSFDVRSIRELDGEPAGRYGLTTEQFEALTTAAERGLFEVPRRTTMADLATELSVSHQALSERIRRATGALVEEALVVGVAGDESR
jgi:hypothetical protein